MGQGGCIGKEENLIENIGIQSRIPKRDACYTEPYTDVGKITLQKKSSTFREEMTEPPSGAPNNGEAQ